MRWVSNAKDVYLWLRNRYLTHENPFRLESFLSRKKSDHNTPKSTWQTKNVLFPTIQQINNVQGETPRDTIEERNDEDLFLVFRLKFHSYALEILQDRRVLRAWILETSGNIPDRHHLPIHYAYSVFDSLPRCPAHHETPGSLTIQLYRIFTDPFCCDAGQLNKNSDEPVGAKGGKEGRKEGRC